MQRSLLLVTTWDSYDKDKISWCAFDEMKFDV